MLLKNGYTVKGVSNSQEGLDALEGSYFDLIICDVMMPVMDGFEMVRQLRQSGSDDYMVKPVNVNEMVLRVGGYDTESDPHTVDVHIGRLRERFRDNPDFKIVTMRGVGYKVVKV